MTACPVCTSTDTVTCADRGVVPVFQNARYADARTAREAARGRLVLAACRRCGFGFNAAFDPALAQYDANYENDQTVSGRFAHHVATMVDQALALVAEMPRPTVVEVGCGQGNFLRQLIDRADGRVAHAVGFDPSVRHPGRDGALTLEARIFDEEAARRLSSPPDLVVLRHVLEHVASPFDLLVSIRRAMGAEATGTILIETPCFEWILAHEAWHDVFYEHCNYSTASSLAHVMRRAGFTDVTVNHVFGGQYLAASGKAGPATNPGEAPAGSDVAERALAFGRSFDRYVATWQGRLEGAAAVGVWGAAAKGVTFSLLMEGAAPIRCLIDVDPKKQGLFAAGSALPILSPAAAAGQGVRTVVVMNPNYAAEIAATVAGLDGAIELIVMDHSQ